MKMTRLVCAVVLSAFVLLCANSMAAEPANPTPAEQADLAAILGRLKARAAATFPTSVSEAIESIENPPVRKEITCPGGGDYDKVVINITTTHITWDARLTINGNNVNPPLGAIGAYAWHAQSTADGRTKYVNATNYIMLDHSKTGPAEEADPFGPLSNEGLLYQELLHGQLLIDAMTSDAAWQADVCSCNFGLGPSENTTHATILGLVNTYLQNAAGAAATIYAIDPPAQTAADADGTFEKVIVDVADLGDKVWSWAPYYPAGCNINQPITVEEVDGKLVAKGTLIDKTKPGVILIQVDPPSVVVFVGIETGIVITPGEIPTLSEWGGIILGILLLVSIVWLIRRRLAPEC